MDSIREGAVAICDTLVRAGYRALFAGGCVRDMLLGVSPKDYDIATNARPEEVAGLFARTVPVGAAFGVQLVVLPQAQYEVTTFRKDGPYLDGRHPSCVTFSDEKEDALRRDFTVNALFYDPLSEKLIDYVGGQDDLSSRVIRTVGNPRERFSEDYLRLMRGIRFAARLGYSIEPDTFQAIREMAAQIRHTSAERVRDELIKILTEGGARRAFELMDDTGLLEHVLPEVSRMKGVRQPEEFHPEGDVYIHTMILLDLLKNPTPTLALGALLHDVGKPETFTEEDRIRFNYHDKVGATMAEAICRRLRMSNHETERVSWLVEQHMRLAHTPGMRESKRKRFVREDGFQELIELGKLDCLASHGDLSTIAWIEEYCNNLKPEECRPAPLITGHDLIALGYEPGPDFKAILSSVEDAQLEGTIHSPDEARAFVLRSWPQSAAN
ncbi:MAG: CCA tRNA nucleotidyltransferase [Candidatus Hydrogenedentes bacterium]|nr:CCA tRNA nucleotidyltransferase [Candidatus Hydrogenedentota bacterium]